MSHGHHCQCGCDHSHDDIGDPAVSYGLYQKIDLERVQCFNEHEEGAGRRVFKPWDERLDVTKVCVFISMYIASRNLPM